MVPLRHMHCSRTLSASLIKYCYIVACEVCQLQTNQKWQQYHVDVQYWFLEAAVFWWFIRKYYNKPQTLPHIFNYGAIFRPSMFCSPESCISLIVTIQSSYHASIQYFHHCLVNCLAFPHVILCWYKPQSRQSTDFKEHSQDTCKIYL